ncbi:MAG TPA: 30S ribosomal protein S4 [Candidatus Nanoarchaeia archaeon]|nr:30S ribosomal protein S4 [Candidatus Nanoarchaeia archaeon]
MGDPKKQKKKFSTPNHPWQKERIEAEKEILKQYGLRRKYEIWKMDSMLKDFLNRAKTLIAQRNPQSDLEKKQLLQRLNSLGLLKKDSKVEDVLNLTLKDVMERRLQTLLIRKQLARTMKQAREFITHEHVAIGARKVTAPSYLVTVNEEPGIRLVKALNLAPQVAQEQKVEKAK